MANIQKLGGIAAFINAVVVVATLVVGFLIIGPLLQGWAEYTGNLAILAILVSAFVLVGPSALGDPSLVADLAVTTPVLLSIQDGLKIVSAVVAVVLMLALVHRMRPYTSLIFVATLFGVLSVLCLVANATLSLYTTSQAASYAQETSASGGQLIRNVANLSFAVITLNGLLYLFVSWSALKSKQLPNQLSYLGI